MPDKLNLIANEGNPAIQGIFISALIIIAGIFPNLKIWEIEVYIPIDSWLLILIGLSSLFYFVSIRVNQNSKIDEKGREWFNTPVTKSPLSKECFNIAIISFILFLLRGGYLFLVYLLK